MKLRVTYWNLLSVPIPALAVLITWATAFWGYGLWNYGLPLAWKTGGCPLPPAIKIACVPFSYSPISFIIDSVFYASIGFAIAILVHRKHRSLPTRTK